jgi:hypothetical protein
VRTEKGGTVWNLPLEASSGPFETRIYEIERGRGGAFRKLLSGLREQGFKLERLGDCYLAAVRKPVDLYVTFSLKAEPDQSSSRCPDAGWPRAFATLHLVLL